jgi:hypothetical protein
VAYCPRPSTLYIAILHNHRYWKLALGKKPEEKRESKLKREVSSRVKLRQKIERKRKKDK